MVAGVTRRQVALRCVRRAAVSACGVEIPPLFHSLDLENFINFVFSDGLQAEDIGQRAVQFPINVMVDTINDFIVGR